MSCVNCVKFVDMRYNYAIHLIINNREKGRCSYAA